jgi:chorismate mutase
MTSLQDLRGQIDTIDQALIVSLSWSWEGITCPISDITDEEIQSLQNTGIIFSSTTCGLLQECIEVSRKIWKLKDEMGITSVVDVQRKELMILDRIAWAPKHLRDSVHTLYEIIHNISVRVQMEWKNLQK